MRWMVGVDIRGTSQGAVGFARALHRDGKGNTFSAVHVLEDKPRAIVAEHCPDRIDELPKDLERLLEPLASGDTFGDLGVTTSKTADEGLHEAAASRPCQGMIIGRRGPSTERTLIRLGRTARRVLRRLEWPTIVVPPDYDAAASLGGPVLLATDLGAGSIGASRFAKALAASLDVDVLVTTVVTQPGELGDYMPRVYVPRQGESEVRQVRERLTQWLAESGLEEARSSVVTGSATAKLLEVAEIAGASVVVAGSRRLSTSDRIFSSSLGAHLAGDSPIPVAIVPPRWRA